MIPLPDIAMVDAYWPVVSVPKATELAPMVKATLDTSAEPSMENVPVTSPVANVTVLEVIHLPAAPDVVEVVALPENVVAVIVFPRAETPERIYIAVPPIDVLLLEPAR